MRKSIVWIVTAAGAAVTCVLLFSYPTASDNRTKSSSSRTTGSPHGNGRAPDAQSSSPNGKYRQRAVEKRSENVNPGRAKEILDEINKNPDINLRSAYGSEVIKKLCEAGYPDEAWDLIEKNAGQVRNSQIAAFFRSTNFTGNEAILKMQQCVFKDEIQTAFESYLEGRDIATIRKFLAEPSFKNGISELRERSYPNLVQNGIGTALSSKFADSTPKEQLDILDFAKELLAKDSISQRNFIMLVGEIKDVDSFAKWDLLSSSLEKKKFSNDAQGKREEIISEMMIRDANQAMSRLSTIGGEQGFYNMQKALGIWTASDSSAASAWFNANRSKLDPSQHDGAVIAFAQSALDYGDKQTASQWAAEVKNPKFKASLTKLIESNGKQSPDTVDFPRRCDNGRALSISITPVLFASLVAEHGFSFMHWGKDNETESLFSHYAFRPPVTEAVAGICHPVKDHHVHLKICGQEH